MHLNIIYCKPYMWSFDMECKTQAFLGRPYFHGPYGRELTFPQTPKLGTKSQQK